MKNKSKHKSKEMIFKVVLIYAFISIIVLFLATILYIVLSFVAIPAWLNLKYVGNLMFISLGSTIISSFLFIVLLFIVGFKWIPVKAKKKKLYFDNYEEFVNQFTFIASNNGYKIISTQAKDIYNERILYRQTHYNLSKKSEFIIFVKMDELYESNIETIEKIIDNAVKEIYGNKKKIYDYIGLTVVICVDNVNDYFKKFINNNLTQDIKISRFFVGVVFNDKEYYFSSQEYGYGVDKYNKLKKQFTKLLNKINFEYK